VPDFGIAIPEQFPPNRAVDVAEIGRGLKEADRAGLHSAWVMEGIIGPKAQLEPVSLLSYAAAVTSGLRLGLGVTLLPLRSPVHLAKALATLDQLSGGRLVVGVGVGGDHTEYRAFGMDQSERVHRFRTGLDLMRRLWQDEPVTAEGPSWSLDAATMNPKPVQDRLPVWIGARSEPAVRRAVELGDGFLGAGSCTTTEFGHQVDIIHDELARRGRDRSDFPLAKRIYVAVDEDAGRARALLGDWFGDLYGDRARAEGSVAAGPVTACVEFVSGVVAAGAELIVLNPVADEARQIRRFVEELVPACSEITTRRAD
jgi:probable F420-dependent oxidoreductase